MIESPNCRIMVVLYPLLGLFFIGFHAGEQVFDSGVGGEFILWVVSFVSPSLFPLLLLLSFYIFSLLHSEAGVS